MSTESDDAIAFIESLKNPEGTDFAGRPIRLLEWQKSYLRRLLDSVDSDGRKRYEKSLLFLPKKQGKTTFIAALALFFLFRRKHGQITCLAQVKEQAALLYRFVASMIRQDGWLSSRKRCRVMRGNQKQIQCYYSDSTLTVLSSDAVGANGLNCSILLYDEVCFSETSELWDAVISGGIARESLLAIGLSTAGFSTASWGYEFYEQAKSVEKDQSVDPTFLAVIYEAPPDADWTDIHTYLKCSPTFRETSGAAIPRIKAMIAAAQKHPAQLRRIRRYHLNQWIGADATTPWIEISRWDACHDGAAVAESLAGRPCYGGIDIGSISDLTATALLFPPQTPDGKYFARLRYYMPADNIADRERTDSGSLYSEWVRRGWIVATPGNWTDYNYIRADLREAAKEFRILGIAIDRLHNASHISQELMADGHLIQPIGQGAFTIIPAARELENMVTRRQLEHFGNPVLRWNIRNCIADTDNLSNVRPSKARSTGRIDGIYALLDAVAIEMAGRGKQGGAEPNIFFF